MPALWGKGLDAPNFLYQAQFMMSLKITALKRKLFGMITIITIMITIIIQLCTPAGVMYSTQGSDNDIWLVPCDITSKFFPKEGYLLLTLHSFSWRRSLTSASSITRVKPVRHLCTSTCTHTSGSILVTSLVSCIFLNDKEMKNRVWTSKNYIINSYKVIINHH